MKTLIISAMSVALITSGVWVGAQTSSKSAVADGSQRMASPGKPAAPINLDYEVKGQLQTGGEIVVKLAFSGIDAGTVTASVRPDPGLVRIDSSEDLRLPVQQKGGAAAGQEIRLIPEKDGIYYVNIFATLAINGEQQYKSFAIPLEVGQVDWAEHLKPQGELKDDGLGNTIIALPATEK